MKDRFCLGCGRVLNDDEHTCPYCGRSDGTVEQEQPRLVISGEMIRLNWAFVLLIAYGIISVVEGIPTAFSSEGVVNTVQGLFGAEVMPSSVEYIRILTLEGFISLFSGIFALIAAFLCIKRRSATLALAACLAASVTLLTEFIFNPAASPLIILVEFLFGILVMRMIYNSRNVFA